MRAFSDFAYFDPICEVKLCCQVPLPHKGSQSTWKNKGMEQRAHVFQVSRPRAQLVTLPAWIVLWFSSLILCIPQNGVILEVLSVWMLGTARALLLLLVSTSVPSLYRALASVVSLLCSSLLRCFSPPLHHQAEKIWPSSWPSEQLFYGQSVIPGVLLIFMYFYLVFTYIHIYTYTHIQVNPRPKSRPKMKQTLFWYSFGQNTHEVFRPGP